VHDFHPNLKSVVVHDFHPNLKSVVHDFSLNPNLDNVLMCPPCIQSVCVPYVKIILAVQMARITAERIAWTAVAVVLFNYLEIYSRLEVRIASKSFGLFIASIAGFLGVYLYLQVYLPFKGFKVNYKKWEQEIPRSIQTATFCGVVASVCFNTLLWPVYSFLTPLIGFIFFMGFTSFLALLN
jgi:hypothetical protein